MDDGIKKRTEEDEGEGRAFRFVSFVSERFVDMDAIRRARGWMDGWMDGWMVPRRGEANAKDSSGREED
jgi:hypothetical protein